MTKTELWASTQELLVEHKASKKLSQALEELLAPKTSGGSINPPMEIGGVMNYYCRFHQQYEPIDNMVMSGGKSKGYCKASISKWNKTNAQIKKLDAQVQEFVTNGEFERAQEKAKESQDLKAILNAHESYNYEQDWADFTKKDVKSEVESA